MDEDNYPKDTLHLFSTENALIKPHNELMLAHFHTPIPSIEAID